jgi:hypothetical protein
MREAHAFVSNTDIRDRERVKRFTLDLARRVAAADLQFVMQCRQLRREMEQRVVTHARTRLQNTWGQGIPVWAAESLRLGNSVGKDLSSEILPAPAGM